MLLVHFIYLFIYLFICYVDSFIIIIIIIIINLFFPILLLLFCTVKSAILTFPFQRQYSCFRMTLKSKSFSG